MGSYLPTFRHNLLIPSSRGEQSKSLPNDSTSFTCDKLNFQCQYLFICLFNRSGLPSISNMLLYCIQGQRRENDWYGQPEGQSPSGSKTGGKVGSKTNILNEKKNLCSMRVKLFSQPRGLVVRASY